MSRRSSKTQESGPKSRVRQASDAQTAAIKENFPRDIAQPTLRALTEAALTTLDRLTCVTRGELSQVHCIGPKAIETLQAALNANGQNFWQA